VRLVVGKKAFGCGVAVGKHKELSTRRTLLVRSAATEVPSEAGIRGGSEL